ncbi:uncharacterized protein MELLADRAFT_87797 [Melampsora larici-populina 98AG31]|uniref:Uncharacterized protein n=1 Tax=Melampsora larici-populina (strain 98AG31 / pathotype 3-4-7) TaxID=747676 RepID=F4RPI2_MELLP|nr:uncharacterized protein MELLADRAFT_87797 [Melampsora larici-populina 98AG31]EGG05533.1 hypothetical protein MELLADRAFT_87797 [Melampsora larici-populina 98AG31]
MDQIHLFIGIDYSNEVFKKEPEKYLKLWSKIGTTLKVGAVEDMSNKGFRGKLIFGISGFLRN